MIKVYLFCHLLAFFLGFILDLCLGDPKGLIHPVQIIGWLISKLDKALHHERQGAALARGAVLVVIVVLVSSGVVFGILAAAYTIHPALGMAVEALLTWSILAIKSLKKHSNNVYKPLVEGDIEGARHAVSMIVGRDTDALDDKGITRAAIETVAENTSDGVIAPMIYTALGGPVFGYFYKSINTMDSMIGYKNDRYLFFGRAAAKLDDVVNFIPARLGAYLMMLGAAVLGKPFNAKEGLRIYKRDSKKSSSPNAAKCEAVCAGALGIRLLGDAVYFGKVVKKPFIGDDTRPVEPEDIRRTNKLMVATSTLCFILFFLIILGIMLPELLNGDFYGTWWKYIFK